ncbi:Agamous-like MADS-box protein AGL61 [Linum grandiflorum]
MGAPRGKPRKLPLKLIENPSARATAFSKRRVGLFNKVSQICLLCDTRAAAFAFSLADSQRVFSVGHPSVDSILNELTTSKNRNKSGRSSKNEVRRMADLIGKQTAEDNAGLSCPVSYFGKSVDNLANGGADLNKLVELLKTTKDMAEARLRRRKQNDSQPAVVAGGDGGDSVKLSSESDLTMTVVNNYEIGSSSNTAPFKPKDAWASDTPMWSSFEGNEGIIC